MSLRHNLLSTASYSAIDIAAGLVGFVPVVQVTTHREGFPPFYAIEELRQPGDLFRVTEALNQFADEMCESYKQRRIKFDPNCAGIFFDPDLYRKEAA